MMGKTASRASRGYERRGRLSPSNLRTQPAHYRVAGPLAGMVVATVWRWRFELVGVVAVWLAWSSMVDALGVVGAIVLSVLVVFVAGLVGSVRRFVTGRAWCMITRHRLRTVLTEVRTTTRTGRLPFIMRMARTPVGERAYVWCRAGICAEDLESKVSQVRSACFARDARVSRHPRWSHMVTVDVVRRDPLAASQVIASPLKPSAAHGQFPGRDAGSLTSAPTHAVSGGGAS